MCIFCPSIMTSLDLKEVSGRDIHQKGVVSLFEQQRCCKLADGFAMSVVEFTFVNNSGTDAKILITSSDSGGYAFYPWKSAELLSQAIYSGHIDVSGRRVLELGAGTGLCGICALKNGASSVVFTDRNDSLVEENIRKNCSLNNIADCDFVPCDWNDVPNLALGKLFDLIIASDCLFESDVFKPFAATLSLLLHKNPSAEAYIAYENRGTRSSGPRLRPARRGQPTLPGPGSVSLHLSTGGAFVTYSALWILT
ncbi:Methyltransferase-like protein 23 [Taenia solium]|eukprot:TsM_000215900 transcript=TsM_000215900 gene=TsM_000215900